MRKNKKKGKGKWEKGKAISQCGYGVDDAEEWSVEELLLDYGQQWRNEWLGE